MLKERLKFVKTDNFVESEARNRLGLTRTNEYIVLAPQTKETEKEQQANMKSKPNYKKWWNLLKK